MRRSKILEASKTVGFEKPILGDFPNLEMNIIPHINLVQFIESSIKSFKPDFIYTHHPNDLNNDHQQVSKACMTALRIFQRTHRIHRHIL